ncbi:hypothetical protein [Azonexus hydrophilus]|uniref:hypothetical protein n=1 Tax=Azonexus hydrophilus TaxID=418702 RepID=UPI00111565F7|nr:hypothetical protein [Azonexus hydrophilus]
MNKLSKAAEMQQKPSDSKKPTQKWAFCLNLWLASSDSSEDWKFDFLIQQGAPGAMNLGTG